MFEISHALNLHTPSIHKYKYTNKKVHKDTRTANDPQPIQPLILITLILSRINKKMAPQPLFPALSETRS